MSEEDSTPTATATGSGTSRIHPTMEQAQIAASHKIIMEGLAFFNPTVEKPALNKLDPTIVHAIEIIKFDPASAVPSFPELYLKMLFDSFPRVEDLIIDADFYSMTTPLQSLLHGMFALCNIQNFEVPVQISAMFQPTRKYHSLHEMLWLPTMLVVDFGELSWFARTQKIRMLEEI